MQIGIFDDLERVENDVFGNHNRISVAWILPAQTSRNRLELAQDDADVNARRRRGRSANGE